MTDFDFEDSLSKTYNTNTNLKIRFNKVGKRFCPLESVIVQKIFKATT